MGGSRLGDFGRSLRSWEWCCVSRESLENRCIVFLDGFCSPMVSAKSNIKAQSHGNLFDFSYSPHH